MIDIKREISKRPRSYLAGLLIAISFVAALLITSAANHTVLVWASTNHISAGDTLDSTNLREIRVLLPENSNKYITPRSSIAGYTSTRSVEAGELIAVSGVTRAPAASDARYLPIRVARNDLPIDVLRGSYVDIYALPIRDSSGNFAPVRQIAHSVLVDNVDGKSRDLGGEIGVVVLIGKSSVLAVMESLVNSRIVMVRSAL